MTSKKELFITEISEEDFRKMNLKGYVHARKTKTDYYGRVYSYFEWEEVDLNAKLTENIIYWLENGPRKDLDFPVTIAIHKDNGPNPDDYYWDKFMNRATGAQTYQLGMGIEHLYSTRDYFEAHGDFWRVAKKDTKSIYRIHIDPSWFEKQLSK